VRLRTIDPGDLIVMLARKNGSRQMDLSGALL
jgi:hypothetical protein